MADPVLAPVAHLFVIKVNLTLSSSLAAMAIGAYLDRHFNIGLVPSFAGFYLALLWGIFIRETWKEALVFCGATLSLGVMVATSTQSIYEVDKNLAVTLCFGAALSAGGFSAAAILTSHKAYLYATALLSSSLSVLIWLQFASSVFGGSTALFKYQLYCLLMLLIGRLAVATQDMISEPDRAGENYVRRAQFLVFEFFFIFATLASILLKQRAEAESDFSRASCHCKADVPDSLCWLNFLNCCSPRLS